MKQDKRVHAKNWGDGHWYYFIYSGVTDNFLRKEHAEDCPCISSE